MLIKLYLQKIGNELNLIHQLKLANPWSRSIHSWVELYNLKLGCTLVIPPSLYKAGEWPRDVSWASQIHTLYTHSGLLGFFACPRGIFRSSPHDVIKVGSEGSCCVKWSNLAFLTLRKYIFMAKDCLILENVSGIGRSGNMVVQVKESTCQCRRQRFDLWVEKIPWRRKWQPTPVFLPGESHGQRSLAHYSPWSQKELDVTKQLNTQEN